MLDHKVADAYHTGSELVGALITQPLHAGERARKWPAWLPLVAAILIGFATIFSISALRHSSQIYREAEVCFTGIEAMINRLDALEWQAIAQRSAGPEIAQEAESIHQSISKTLAFLGTSGIAQEDVRHVEEAYNTYRTAFEKEMSLLKAGRPVEAETMNIGQVDPGFDNLKSVIAASKNSYGSLAGQIETWADRGALAAIALALTLVGLLFWAAERAKRTVALAATEKRVLQRGEQALEGSLSLLRATLESTADGILVVNRHGKIVTHNHKFIELWNMSEGVLAMRDDDKALDFMSDQLKDPIAFIARVRQLYDLPDDDSYDLLELEDGRIYERYSHPQKIDGKSVGRVWSFRDVTQRKRLEQELEYQAFHDALTGLPNRFLFMDRLDQSLVRSARTEGEVAVLFLDLDDFKVVNDTFGHKGGDRVLVQIGERIRQCVRPGDTIARLGGDEFTVLLDDVFEAEVLQVADRILKHLQSPLDVGSEGNEPAKSASPFTAFKASDRSLRVNSANGKGKKVFVTPSIGVALSSSSDERPDDLLREADIALYEAKKGGKARYMVFRTGMNSTALDRLQMEVELRKALECNEFKVFYQPVLELDTGMVVKVEALVRWEHPEHGLVFPESFIPFAEESGLIVPIGQWVIEQACKQAVAWKMQYDNVPPITMAVNLSARQVQHPTLISDVMRALKETGLDPRYLELEITESAAMEDAEASAAMLQELKSLGIKLAIDDFGTGHSTLSYLRNYPVDTLKLDRSLVDEIGRDRGDTAIVRAVLAFAKTLGLQVTAEGIETSEQLVQLRDLGCDQGQGYYFARPVPAESASAMFATGPRWVPRHGHVSNGKDEHTKQPVHLVK